MAPKKKGESSPKKEDKKPKRRVSIVDGVQSNMNRFESAEQAMDRNEDKKARRSRFVRPSVCIGQEELERRRAASVAVVHAAMAEAKASAATDRLKTVPLRRFGCKLVVAMFHHKRNHEVQRKIVVMEDNIKWGPSPTQFQGWAEVCMGLPGAGLNQNPTLTFQYFDEHGSAVRIDDRFKLQAWLDECWCRHPLELHCFEVDTLIAELQERDDIVRDIFDQYDCDRSGCLSAAEVQEMLLNLELAEDLGISKEDLVHYVVAEFEAADVDDSGSISFDEFVRYYNGLQDFIKSKLTRENRHTYVHLKFREECIEARSKPTPLRELLKVHKGHLSPKLHPASAMHDGDYSSAQILKYDVHLTMTDDSRVEELGDTRVMIQTLLPDKVENFIDCTDAMGQLGSPVVAVEIEDNAEVASEFSVRFPHCFDEGVTKDDIILCYGNFTSSCWNEVEPEHFQLAAGNDLVGTRPSVIVTMFEEGIIAAFSRNDRKLAQRVRAVTFLPKKIIPLETELLRIYLVPDLPGELQELQHREEHDRGLVYMGGSSEVMAMKLGSGVHITVEQQDPETHAALWEGTCISMEYEFDPEDFMKAIQLQKQRASQEAGEAGAAGGADVPIKPLEGLVTGSLGVKIVTADLHERRRAHQAKKEVRFNIHVRFHAFPPPGHPLNLAVKSRTSTNLFVAWDAPAQWGGCCLDEYELQLRERTHKGLKEWTTVYEGEKHMIGISMSCFACELRCRVSNVGCSVPSEWSPAYELGSEKEEEAATNVQRMAKGNAARKAGGATKERQGQGTENDGGMAVVEQDDLKDMVRQKHIMRGKSGKTMAGWSRFRRKIGEFYMLIGVHGGVNGKLFDLSPEQVESMVLANSAEVTGDEIGMSTDVGAALISLGYCAVWVVETLAHHTENSTEWIEFMNEVGGMVELAASLKTDVDEAREGIMRGILFSLFEIYETLRQCEGAGFVTAQLRHNYGKGPNKQMKEEWAARMHALKNDVACGVMSLALHHRKQITEKAMADDEREAMRLRKISHAVANGGLGAKYSSSRVLLQGRMTVGNMSNLTPMAMIDNSEYADGLQYEDGVELHEGGGQTLDTMLGGHSEEEHVGKAWAATSSRHLLK